MLPIATERLILRDFVAEDLEAFRATSNDSAYQQFYAISETTPAFREELFARFLNAAQEAERTKYQLAICIKSGDLIGTCGVRLEDSQNQQASFGCGIHHSYWGQGYASEASVAVIDFGFSTLSIERIYAETISENMRVQALVERLGMRKEGEFVHHRYFRDRWWNTAIYGILKEEWSLQPKP